jgi:hypothetical protein
LVAVEVEEVVLVMVLEVLMVIQVVLDLLQQEKEFMFQQVEVQQVFQEVPVEEAQVQVMQDFMFRQKVTMVVPEAEAVVVQEQQDKTHLVHKWVPEVQVYHHQ